MLGEPMTLLNCDMGEGYGIWRLGDDARIMPAIHIANVACGFHASDFNHMRATVRLAQAHGVEVGAHPSLPDRQGFGRREKIYPARGHRFLAKYYVDLDYADDGKLIITREHEAVDPADASNRAVRALREGLTRSVGGKDIKVRADTICVHSDTPGAHLVAQAVHDRLVSEGFIAPRSKKH